MANTVSLRCADQHLAKKQNDATVTEKDWVGMIIFIYVITSRNNEKRVLKYN